MSRYLLYSIAALIALTVRTTALLKLAKALEYSREYYSYCCSRFRRKVYLEHARFCYTYEKRQIHLKVYFIQREQLSRKFFF